jgi:hypothetical protein
VGSGFQDQVQKTGAQQRFESRIAPHSRFFDKSLNIGAAWHGGLRALPGDRNPRDGCREDRTLNG